MQRPAAQRAARRAVARLVPARARQVRPVFRRLGTPAWKAPARAASRPRAELAVPQQATLVAQRAAARRAVAQRLAARVPLPQPVRASAQAQALLPASRPEVAQVWRLPPARASRAPARRV